jgi:hypothetical protein
MKSSDIAVSGLRKAYGDKAVLDGISYGRLAGIQVLTCCGVLG